jgi:hypothetical protein
MSRKGAVELELSMDELKSFAKANIHPEVDVEVKDGKVYVLIPLDLIAKYEIAGGKVKIIIPVR